ILNNIEIYQSTSYWWQSGFVYSAFVLLVAVPFLANIGKNETKRKHVVTGGILGGFVMLLGVFFIYIVILSKLNDVEGKYIPTLSLAEKFHPTLGIFFSIILLIAIYTTAEIGR